jgi:hypothetical protein
LIDEVGGVVVADEACSANRMLYVENDCSAYNQCLLSIRIEAFLESIKARKRIQAKG